jgi:hypothetical protein
MKRLILVFCFGLQLCLATDLLAWSPVDAYRSWSGFTAECRVAVAATEDSEAGKKEKKENKQGGEEEPDCD